MKSVGEMPAPEPVVFDDDTARLSVNTCMMDCRSLSHFKLIRVRLMAKDRVKDLTALASRTCVGSTAVLPSIAQSSVGFASATDERRPVAFFIANVAGLAEPKSAQRLAVSRPSAAGSPS